MGTEQAVAEMEGVAYLPCFEEARPSHLAGTHCPAVQGEGERLSQQARLCSDQQTLCALFHARVATYTTLANGGLALAVLILHTTTVFYTTPALDTEAPPPHL